MQKTTERLLALGFAAVITITPGAFAEIVPLEYFTAKDDLEVTVWAQSPMLKNPTNIDIDKDGRIWVAEGVNYRSHYNRQPEGDRIVILEDTDGDGKADKSTVFVQEPFLRAPLGIAVLDNKIIVSMTPDMIVYTDVNRDRKFDPAVDKREVILSGFNGRAHDHSLHSVTVGPDGQWYWSAGNAGSRFTDKSGRTFRMGSAYDPFYGGKGKESDFSTQDFTGQKSDDGHVYIGGFTARMNPDGSKVQIIGHNFRNSYEQTVTSFGDVFQNDNDDPPACRTSFLMEFSNAGFCSLDGKRSWGADSRPGQSVPVAEWRQEDPGSMPPGDVYGGGAPTGIAFYENGALGKQYEGMLLSCESARNVVFGYFPKADGAGYKLERFDFLTSNKEKEFAGTDFKGGGGSISADIKTMFRPSDVAVSPDGAIYVSDWFDARVGGHSDLDNSTSGAIYRIAPKGFKPKIPKLDLTTIEGQIKALKSPSVNVRNLGFNALKAQGAVVVPPVSRLLSEANPYFRARAIWLLSQLGPAGIARVEPLLKNRDTQIRVAAFRALRRQNHQLIKMAGSLVTDPSPAVRREIALAMRDVPIEQSKIILVALAKTYDGQDRSYLEAWGTGCTDKESAIYDALAPAFTTSDAARWTPQVANLAWRLHPPQSVAGLKARALSKELPEKDRKAALVAIGFIPTQDAANAVVEIAAKTDAAVKADAIWWLLNQKDIRWKGFGLAEILKQKGIYDPDNIELISATIAPAEKTTQPPASEILKLKGNVARGKTLAVSCQACHRLGNEGVDHGPNLTGFAKMQTGEVVLNAIIDPSAEISHGYEGSAILLTNGEEIDGIILSNSDPVIIRSAAGLTQTVPAKRIKSKKPLGRSLMLSADQMGLKPQDLADLLAYLKSL